MNVSRLTGWAILHNALSASRRRALFEARQRQWLAVDGIDARNFGMGGAYVSQLDEPFHPAPATLDRDFNRTIRTISYPADQPEGRCCFDRPGTVPDALDPAVYTHAASNLHQCILVRQARAKGGKTLAGVRPRFGSDPVEASRDAGHLTGSKRTLFVEIQLCYCYC
jgi:hypothetical protein